MYKSSVIINYSLFLFLYLTVSSTVVADNHIPIPGSTHSISGLPDITLNLKPDLAIDTALRASRLCKNGNAGFSFALVNNGLKDITGIIDMTLTIQYKKSLIKPDRTQTRIPEDWNRTLKITNLKVGEKRAISFSNVLVDSNAGEAMVSVKIDPKNRINERNESNNTSEIKKIDLTRLAFCPEASVSKPDLVFNKNMGFGKSNQRGGACHLNIAVEVINQSPVASESPARVHFRLKSSNKEGYLSAEKTVPNIGGHKRSQVIFSFSLDEIIAKFGGWGNQVHATPRGMPATWTLRLYAEVDNARQVPEVFDSNNVTISVKPFSELVGAPNLLYRHLNEPCF